MVGRIYNKELRLLSNFIKKNAEKWDANRFFDEVVKKGQLEKCDAIYEEEADQSTQDEKEPSQEVKTKEDPSISTEKGYKQNEVANSFGKKRYKEDSEDRSPIGGKERANHSQIHKKAKNPPSTDQENSVKLEEDNPPQSEDTKSPEDFTGFTVKRRRFG